MLTVLVAFQISVTIVCCLTSSFRKLSRSFVQFCRFAVFVSWRTWPVFPGNYRIWLIWSVDEAKIDFCMLEYRRGSPSAWMYVSLRLGIILKV